MLVDFVLESGSGEDGLVNLSIGDQHLDMDLPSAENDSTPSLGAPSFSQSAHVNIPEDVHIPAHQMEVDGERPQSYRKTGETRRVPSGKRSWPLRDPEEASLLKHFMDRTSAFVSCLVPWSSRGTESLTAPHQFDCTDHQQHFAVHIPLRARYCDALFNAIMALSARHLSCTTRFDPYVSDHYYQACLETLIPALDDHGVTMDDDLLAATVILRLLEEFDGEAAEFPHRDVLGLHVNGDHSPTGGV